MLNKMNPILLIFQSLNWIKAFLIWFVSSIIGWAAAVLLQTPPAHWYEQPAVIAAGVSGAVVIIGLFVNRYFHTRDKKEDREEEVRKQHLSSTDRLQELTQQELTDLLARRNDLHTKEIAFLKDQLTIEKVSNFEARTRAHRAINEVNNNVIYIFTLHTLMSRHGLEIPTYKPKTYDEIMHGISGEIEKFKKSLNVQIEEIKSEEV